MIGSKMLFDVATNSRTGSSRPEISIAVVLAEVQPGTGDQIVDDAGHQHLAGQGAGRDALGDVQREARTDPSRISISPVCTPTASRMPSVFAQRAKLEGAPDCASRTVEARGDLGAADADRNSAVARDRLDGLLDADDRCVRPSDDRRAARRSGRRTHPRHHKLARKRWSRAAFAGQKFLDLIDDAIGIAGPDRMIASGNLDKARAPGFLRRDRGRRRSLPARQSAR